MHLGEGTATQLLESVANLPVVAAPNMTYVYNNRVFAVGGYLPLLATKVAPAGRLRRRPSDQRTHAVAGRRRARHLPVRRNAPGGRPRS